MRSGKGDSDDDARTRNRRGGWDSRTRASDGGRDARLGDGGHLRQRARLDGLRWGGLRLPDREDRDHQRTVRRFPERGGGSGPQRALQPGHGERRQPGRHRAQRNRRHLHLQRHLGPRADAGELRDVLRRTALCELAAQRTARRGSGRRDDGGRRLHDRCRRHHEQLDHAQPRSGVCCSERGRVVQGRLSQCAAAAADRLLRLSGELRYRDGVQHSPRRRQPRELRQRGGRRDGRRQLRRLAEPVRDLRRGRGRLGVERADPGLEPRDSRRVVGELRALPLGVLPELQPTDDGRQHRGLSRRARAQRHDRRAWLSC